MPMAPVTNFCAKPVRRGLWSSTGPKNTSTGVPPGSVNAITSSASRSAASFGFSAVTAVPAFSTASRTEASAYWSRTSQPTASTRSSSPGRSCRRDRRSSMRRYSPSGSGPLPSANPSPSRANSRQRSMCRVWTLR
ncbi:hypothetical protein LUX39_40520 [Actinomadura madurae]|nr:hypothetical protein [Actinomadura madurae]MCP9970582.1 hypothetical protein [Actinomadura madurae]MCQ0005389.1 hypothetical protein [Actinomadura madurae]MCQ0019297.1 hypothetical protein [Actinomadura madurae]